MVESYDEDDDEDLRFSGHTGGQLVHASLVECGVQHVFGYSGGANLPILDQFSESPIQFVMNRSEQCCGHAAEGYARSTGRVGVVLTTSGPGLTNIITPLQDAKGDSTPMVALSGQVPLAAVGSDAFQECLAVDLTRPCTKWSYQIKSVEEVRSVVHEAFHVAASGKPGPVHLDLPKDVMTAVLRGAGVPLPMLPPPVTPSKAVLEEVARMLSVAEKPILYVGQARSPEISPEIARDLTRDQIARDLTRDHPGSPPLSVSARAPSPEARSCARSPRRRTCR